MSDEAVLKAKIDATGAESGATAVQRAIDRISSSWVGASAKVFIAEQAFKRVWAAASEGAQFDESLGRLNRQMANFDSSAGKMVSRLKEVTSGQLSNAEAATAASRALSIGMNPDQIAVFAEAAEALSDRLGGSVAKSMDELTDSMVTGRTKLLGNLGVWFDLEKATKDYALANGRTVESITKQEKAMLGAQAVTGQLKTALAGMSDEQPSNADQMERMSKTFDDMGLAAKRASATGLMSFIDAMDKIKNSLKAFIPQNEFTTGKWFDKLIGMDQTGVGKDKAEKLSKEPIEVDKKIPTMRLDARIQRERDATTAITEELKRQNEYQLQFAELGAQLNEASSFAAQQSRVAIGQETLRIEFEQAQKELAIVRKGHDEQLAIGFDTTEQKVAYEEKYRDTLQELLNKETAARNRYEEGVQISAKQSRVIQGREQEELGKRIQEDLTARYNMEETLRQRNYDGMQQYVQGEIELTKFQYGSQEELMGLERLKLQDQLAFKLRLKREEIQRLMVLQQNGAISDEELAAHGDPTMDKNMRLGLLKQGFAQDALLAEQQRGDVFAGWRRGMQQYVQDTKSGFGLAQDMARRTAQMMEQSFQRFFFDAMEGKITSLKDVLSGFLDFAKQILSQLASQLIVKGLLTALTGAGGSSVGGLAGGSGDVGGFALRAMGGISAFASGGIATRPMLRWAGGGMNLIGEGQYNEAYVPLPDGRTIPVSFKGSSYSGAGQPSVSVPVNVQVINQHSGADVQVKQNRGSNGMNEIQIVVKQVVNKAIGDGAFDDVMRTTYGASRQPRRV